MLYGSECWSITKAQAKKVEVAEPRLLRWLCGKTRFDMIPNGVFREKHKVKNIISKKREKRLRWFGHVKRRLQTAPLRSMEALIVEALGRMDRIVWRGRIRIDSSFICTLTLPEVSLEAVSLLLGISRGKDKICLHSTAPYPA
ncbi:hypothetical protein Tco_1513325 [Tanacetum coccineum]